LKIKNSKLKVKSGKGCRGRGAKWGWEIEAIENRNDKHK
jgi:hypothetical protein